MPPLWDVGCGPLLQISLPLTLCLLPGLLFLVKTLGPRKSEMTAPSGPVQHQRLVTRGADSLLKHRRLSRLLSTANPGRLRGLANPVSGR